jgi:hypothetical protein
MDPVCSPHMPYPSAPGWETTCYLPKLNASVALRSVTSLPSVPHASPGARQQIPSLLPERERISRAGWFV